MKQLPLPPLPQPQPQPPMKQREHQMQAALIRWVRLSQKGQPGLRRLFAVPNGGHRLPAVAARLKAEGVRAGVPDLVLPVARGKYHGLFIELKVPPNKLTPDQAAELDALEDEGYATRVCHSVTEAMAELQWYLGLQKGCS